MVSISLSILLWLLVISSAERRVSAAEFAVSHNSPAQSLSDLRGGHTLLRAFPHFTVMCSPRITGMEIQMTRIGCAILEQLKCGEKGVLALVVGVGKVLSDSGGVKGDLMQQVKSALSQLVACKQVVEFDGWYSLKSSK